MVTVYAVASAKGGVGKTTTTAALATILSESGADVVAVDADIGMSNLAGVLGMEVGQTTVHDVLAGRAAPFDAVHDGPAGLRVVPGDTDLDAYAEADPSGIREVIRAFDGVDYVLVDAGAGLSHDSSLPLALADETLLVSTPERGALGDTEKTRQLTERLGGSVVGAALTRVDPAQPETALADELLDAEVLGRIPEDDTVAAAERATEPLVTYAPTAPATTAYRELARALTGESVSDPDAEVASTGTDEPSTDTDSERSSTAGVAAETTDREAEASDDATPEGADIDDASSDDEIIVADAGPVGMTDAGDEEEILVADETPVDDSDERDSGEVDSDEEGASEVDSDESGGSAAADPVDSADDDAADTDEVASLVDEAEPSTEESEPDEAATASDDEVDEVDDELAGSVPFRDDDSGVGENGRDDETDSGVTTDEHGDETADEDEAETTGESGGFFSRLFGR